jgi:outer membrane receptor protein involved in Fe transport
LQTNITVYHMKWDDIQVEANDPTPGLFALGIINFPEAEINGVEADFNWVPGDNWNITGNVGYNDAELSEDAVLFAGSIDGERIVEDGTQLPLVPDWKGSLSVRYGFDRLLFQGEPFVRLVYEYTGDSVNSLAGIQSVIEEQAVRDQDSYSIVNLRAGITADRWTAMLFIDNVTDEYAEQFYNDRWNFSRATVNRPRTWGLNFRTYFGGGK